MRRKKVFRSQRRGAGSQPSMTACGSDDGGDGDSDAKGSVCGKNIAFLGALTGDAGALGQNMLNGEARAGRGTTKDNADCKIGVKQFDSQGSPDKAPGLATQIINDDSIVGLVGLASQVSRWRPARRSTRPVCRRSPRRRPTSRSPTRAGSPGTASSATTRRRARRRQVPHRDRRRQEGLRRRRQPGLQQRASRATREGRPRRRPRPGDDQISVGQTDMSAVVTQIKAADADAVSTPATTPRRACSPSQLRQSGFKGTFMSGDGLAGPAFVKARVPRVPRRRALPPWSPWLRRTSTTA